MKAFTNLEQSKKLAEILPLESADMYWKNGVSDKYIQCFTPFVSDDYRTNVNYDYDIPCWSLYSLLDILAEQDFIIKSVVYSNEYQYNIDIPSRHCKIYFSSLLDAAFEMICWLKENNKL